MNTLCEDEKAAVLPSSRARVVIRVAMMLLLGVMVVY